VRTRSLEFVVVTNVDLNNARHRTNALDLESKVGDKVTIS